MITGNYFEDNAELRFLLRHGVAWEKIVPARERGFADARLYQQSGDDRFALAPNSIDEAIDLYVQALQSAGDFSGNHVAPRAREMEETGLQLVDGQVKFPEAYLQLYGQAIEAGFAAFPLPRSWGGLNFPLPVSLALKEMLTRASNSFEISIAVTFLADVLRRYGNEELKQRYIPAILSGEMSAAMALSEPDFGSDLANVRSRAVKQSDGSYRITGTKRFITHGCGVGKRPAILATRARSSGSGARGLSFFLVQGKDAQVAKIEHKLGLVCSPTCEMIFEDAPAVLIGGEGEGLIKYVMSMLNGGRIGVAVESIGVSHAALSEARKYAGERLQFGVAIEKHAAVARMLNEMDARLQANRALVYQTGELVELYEQRVEVLSEAGQSDREIRRDSEASRLDRLASLWTSLAKLECSEGANRIAYDAMQVFGGVGFTEEYDIARIFRDARISTIYEGTSQIHINAAIAALSVGLGDGDVVHNDCQQRLEQIQDAERRRLCTLRYEEARQIARQVIELPRAARDQFAQDAVYSFVAALCLMLLARLCDLAAQHAEPDFSEKMASRFDCYLALSSARLAAAGAMLSTGVATSAETTAAARS